MIKILMTILFPIVYFTISWFFPWDKILNGVSISPSYFFDVLFVGLTLYFFRSKLEIGKTKLKFLIIRIILSVLFGLLCVVVINFFNLNAPFKFVDKLFIQVLVLAPIIEELIFRSAFFIVFKRAKLNLKLQGVINSLLFSLSHLPAIWILPDEFKSFVIFQLFYTFILGWICFKARQTSKGIFEPIIVHFVFNLIFYISVINKVI